MTTKIIVFYYNQLPKQIIEILHMHDYQVTTKSYESFDQHDLKDKDLIVLYDMLDLDIIKHIKSTHQYIQLPLVVISKSTQVSDHIETLKLGADDFIYASENIHIVLARIERLLKRYHSVEKKSIGCVQFKNLEMDLSTYEVKIHGKTAPITHKEFEILRLFISNPDKTLSKEDIYKVIWRHTEMYSENVINVHIRHLRKKIEVDPSNPNIIMTVWGFGYRLGEGEVEYIK
jgi:DNA-binding response OmpR family regulator